MVDSLRVGRRPRQIPMSLLSFRRARWTDGMAEMMDGRVKQVQVRLARMDSTVRCDQKRIRQERL